MSLFKRLGERWQALAERRCVRINPAHVDTRLPGDAVDGPLLANEHYFRLWLVEIFLEDDRGRLSASQPVVYSVTELLFGDRRETLSHLADPGAALDSSAASAQRRAVLNYPLTPLLPFNGGAIELEAGLLLLPNTPVARAFIKTLEGFSRLLVAPEVSKVLNVAAVLAGSFVDVVDAVEAGPEVRFRQTLGDGAAADALTPGYFVVFGAPSDAPSPAQLWIQQGRLQVGTSAGNAVPLTGCPYLLFRLETRTGRDDWDSLSRIADPYRRAVECVAGAAYEIDADGRRRLLEESRRRMEEARFAALHAKELTALIGRNQVFEAMDLGYERARARLGQGAIPGEAVGALSEAMRRTISVDAARSQGFAAEAPPPARAVPPGVLAAESPARPVPPSPPPPAALAAAPPFDPPLPPVILHRTPHMDLVDETPLHPGDRFSVSVYADCGPARAGEISRELNISVPAGTKAVSVDVWIAATEHFTLRGAREKVMEVVAAEQATAPLRFDLTVGSDLATLADARVWAYFSYQGRPSGQVSIAVPLQPAAASEPSAAKSALPKLPTPAAPAPAPALAPVMSIAPAPPPLDVVAVETTARTPDLTIEITDPRGDLRSLECRISSPHLQLSAKARRCKWSLRQETGALVAALMDQFVRPKIPPEARLLSLRGAGGQLWDVSPRIVKEAIWELIDAGKLETILVVSAEPYFPWELMVPSRIDAGTLAEREPLGVEFVIGRWIPVDHRSPPQRVSLTRSLIIAPEYPGPSPLPLAHAAVEARQVCACVAGRILTPAQFLKVKDALFVSHVDLVHFVCHGAASPAPGIQVLHLEDYPFDSNQMRGLPVSAVHDEPFVFLNACEVGRPVPALNGIGGFALEFIKRGATGVVAPLWSVKDEWAHEVAVAFYDRLRAQPPVAFAEIIRDIRARAYKGSARGEDTYAAYCFYGDPFAIAQGAYT